LSVTFPPAPPPVRSVPAVTPVIVPEPALLHAQVVPFHWSTWPLAQVLSRLKVTLPVLPPPASPDPAVTAVIVPVPALLHAQVVPFHWSTWPLAQVLSRLRVTFPVLPPPARPVPAVTPVIVPAPGNVCPEMKCTSPVLVIFIVVPETESVGKLPDGTRDNVLRKVPPPFTSSRVAGVVVPIPI